LPAIDRFFLGEPNIAGENHPIELLVGQRGIVRVAFRVALNLFFGHRLEPRAFLGRKLRWVCADFFECLTNAGHTPFARFCLPGGLK